MNRSYSKIRHIQEANQRLEKRMLSEQGPLGRAIEVGSEFLAKLFSKEESQLGKAFSKGSGRMGEVAVESLPHEIENFISKIPTKVIFDKSVKPILQDNINILASLHGSVSRYYKKLGNSSGLGVVEILIKDLETKMSNSIGTTVNLQDMVETAFRIEKDLIASKTNLPIPKGKGAMEEWYNYLYTEIGDIKKIISSFKELVKEAKIK